MGDYAKHEEHKAMAVKVFEAISQGDYEALDSVISPEYVNHNMPTPEPGLPGLRVVLEMFRQAFPDFKVELTEVLAEGDKVVTQGFWSGTQQGAFMGIPATGKAVRVEYIDIWRIEHGKFVENWVQMDRLGMMQQLGVVPAGP